MGRHRINTTKRMQDPVDQWGFLLDSSVHGTSDTIERQEKTGQSQLVHSDRLPSKLFGPREEFEALGFQFGDPDKDDPLFMPATLPEGWEKRATDHSMGSVIVDTLGRERVSIFYKAAFYDRDAHMSLTGLHWYVQKAVEYDGPAFIFDDEWATREAVADEMRKARDERLERAAEFRGFAEGDDPRRDARNRSACAEHAAENEAKAALYDAALAKLDG